jgi:arylsulfatase A
MISKVNNMRRKFYVWALLTVTGLTLIGNSLCHAQSGKKLPNVIFILADDLGYGDLRKFNPDAQIATPNLTRLAGQGMIFTNAHSASSVCTPSRYGILTGRYAFRSTLKNGVLNGSAPALIEDNRFTVADLAKNVGYQTAIIGKWHLGLGWKPLDTTKNAIRYNASKEADLSNIDFGAPVLKGPNNLGFDYSYILPASLDMSPYLYLENGKCTDSILVPVKDHNSGRGIFWRGGFASKSFKIENTLDNFIDKAIDYIGKASGNQAHPFFLFLTLTAPHTPWLPASAFKNKSNAGIYGDFVVHTDDAVGRILRCLDSLQLTENTIVIFSSDNGADWKKDDLSKFPAHKANFIFRGEKSDIWEGGHHVPLIIRWPAGIAANRSSDDIICLNDLMATFAGLTGQQLPEDAGPDSYNFWPLISGTGKAARPNIIHHSIDGMFAIREGRWKFIDGNGSGGWSAKNPDDKAPGQLYDMENDERETTNVYDKHPELVKKLKALLEQQKRQGFSVQHTVDNKH